MVIIGEFIGGAALGAAFGVLFDVVKEAVDKPTAFKSLLVNIKFSLDFLKPVIEKIGQHNVELGLPDEEIKYLVKEMEEGVKLVQKSAKVSKWNCMKSYYTDQLIELDGSLKRLFHILMVQGIRDAKETLILARKHQDQLIESANNAKETLVLAQKNTDQLIESAKDGKETLVLARQNNDQLVASARDGKKTLVLARKIKRMLKRIDCMVPACTNKGKTRNRRVYIVSNGSKSAGRSHILETSDFRVFSLAELKTATRNFNPDEKIGEGSFGNIFRGWVDEKTLAPSKVGTGMAVAVKRFSTESIQGAKLWQSEENFLRFGMLSHPNLLKLLGYCCEKKNILSVYEFVQRGSLDNHLYRRIPDKEPLSWDNRLKIAIGAARGLTLLHSLRIIHRDVKPSHILLDGDYNPKISGFSLAHWGPADGESYMSFGVSDTFGYMDPEYAMTGRLSVKSDVYSFGVVLLEILTGLKAVDQSRHSDEEISLVDWAIRLLSDETELQTIMDTQIEGQYTPQEAFQTAHLALKCLQRDPESRPFMKEVVEELACIQAMKEKPNQSDPFVEEAALRATAARMCYRCLELDMIEIVSIG